MNFKKNIVIKETRGSIPTFYISPIQTKDITIVIFADDIGILATGTVVKKQLPQIKKFVTNKWLDQQMNN